MAITTRSGKILHGPFPGALYYIDDVELENKVYNESPEESEKLGDSEKMSLKVEQLSK